jgi:tRNA (adenine22-N1)-methyltransferase
MNLSDRLLCISNFLPACTCIADIGTDHGYIPIHAIQTGKCKHAIASDIRKGPILVARKNISLYGLENEIETRVGPGLSTLKKGEADVILIAGMGGNMIADILEQELELASEAKAIIMQPVQYPEELRKYLFLHEFDIIDEELSKEGNKYYHIIRAAKAKNNHFNKQNYEAYNKEVFYYIGIELMNKKHPLLLDYVNFKLKRIDIILKELVHSENIEKKNELSTLKNQFKEVKACLKAVEK